MGKFTFQLAICLASTPELPEPRKRELESIVRLGGEVAKKLFASLFGMSWTDDFPKSQQMRRKSAKLCPSRPPRGLITKKGDLSSEVITFWRA